jgi:hypothetical protein
MRFAVSISFFVLLGTGCLFAPARPAGTGIDGGGDDGGGNGGDCMLGDVQFGRSVIARDRLIRAGHSDTWYLHVYAPNARAGACPVASVKVSELAEVAVDQVVSIQAIELVEDELFVLVVLQTGSMAIDLKMNGINLRTDRRFVASNYIPQAIGDEPAGFIAGKKAEEIWFGGGTKEIAIVPAGDDVVVDAMPVTTDADDVWYHAVRSTMVISTFALIGVNATYSARLDGSEISASVLRPHPCTLDCAGLAYTVPSTAKSPQSPIVAFSIDRTSGLLETIESGPSWAANVHTPQPSPSTGVVLDAAIGELGGDPKIDVAMLWGARTHESSTQLIVYQGLLENATGGVLAQMLIDDRSVDRIAVVQTKPNPRILALSADKGIARCLELDESLFEDCR